MSISTNTAVNASGFGKEINGRKELQRAAKELDSIFYLYMLKAMRETVPKDGLFGGGEGEDVITSLLDQELSLYMANSSRGSSLSAQILEQMERVTEDKDKNPGAPPPTSPVTEAKNAYTQALPPKAQINPSATLPPLGPAIESHTENRLQDILGLKYEGRVSSNFGLRKDPFTGNIKNHAGIDIAAPEGSSVFSAGDGKVVFSGERRGYGNLVILEHGNGVQTFYGHNSNNLVKVGDKVKKGEVIALVGHTGRATGPHLHFEIRDNGRVVNPGTVLSRVVNFSKVL